MRSKWSNFFSRNKLYDLPQLLEQIRIIRNGSTYLAICPEPTGSNWLGIERATQNLFPLNTFKIPQYYSKQKLTDKDLKQLISQIVSMQFEAVILSGFPPYFEKVVRLLNELNQKVFCIFHGTLSELGYGNEAAAAATLPFKLAKQKQILRLGVLRKDLAEAAEKIFGIDCFHIIHTPLVTGKISQKTDSPNIKIGIFGGGNFNKNIYNQIAGALMVEKAEVHVLENESLRIFFDSAQIIQHPKLPPEKFVELLGAMDLNLYLSFSESWGQIVTESLMMGVPCIASSNSCVYDYDSEMREEFTMDRFDNPKAIAEKIRQVIVSPHNISVRGKKYVEQLNRKSNELLAQFLKLS